MTNKPWDELAATDPPRMWAIGTRVKSGNKVGVVKSIYRDHMSWRAHIQLDDGRVIAARDTNLEVA